MESGNEPGYEANCYPPVTIETSGEKFQIKTFRVGLSILRTADSQTRTRNIFMAGMVTMRMMTYLHTSLHPRFHD